MQIAWNGIDGGFGGGSAGFITTPVAGDFAPGGDAFNGFMMTPVQAAGTMALPTSIPAPVAINARTTYGVDTSAANNYGLGPSYQSTGTLAVAQTQAKAAPSILWLVAFLVILAVWK